MRILRGRVEKLEYLASDLCHISTPCTSAPGSSDESSQCDEITPNHAEVERDQEPVNGFHTLRIIKDICDRELTEAERDRERKNRLSPIVPDPTDEDIQNTPNFNFVSSKINYRHIKSETDSIFFVFS